MVLCDYNQNGERQMTGKHTFRVPLKDFDNPIEPKQIIILPSDNNYYYVESKNTKSATLKPLLRINQVKECSSTERKFIQLWTYFFPEIELIFQMPLPNRFRADFFHIPTKTVIETHGGVWLKGGHTTGVGVTNDCRKICICTSLGYKFFAISTQMITEEWLRLIANTILMSEGK